MEEAGTTIRVQLLYFDGCPSYKRAWNDILSVASQEHLDITVKVINVDSPEKAEALKFAGSPTIKVEGEDLEGYDGPGVMACRVYRENGNQGWPSRELLGRKLREAAPGSGSVEAEPVAMSGQH